MKNILKYIVTVSVIVLVGCKETNRPNETERKTRPVRTVQDSIAVNPKAGNYLRRSAGESVTNTGGSTGAAVKARPRPDDYRGGDDKRDIK